MFSCLTSKWPSLHLEQNPNSFLWPSIDPAQPGPALLSPPLLTPSAPTSSTQAFPVPHFFLGAFVCLILSVSIAFRPQIFIGLALPSQVSTVTSSWRPFLRHRLSLEDAPPHQFPFYYSSQNLSYTICSRSAFKSTDRCFRGLRFDSQYPRGGLQLSVIPVPRRSHTFFWLPQAMRARDGWTDMQRNTQKHKMKINVKNKKPIKHSTHQILDS